MTLLRDPKRIGGHDIAAICRESPFMQPIDVFCRLTDRALPKKTPDIERLMKWGLRKESLIIDSFEEDHNVKLQRNVFFNHPTRQFVISPDALEWPIYLEVKAPQAWKRKLYGEPESSDVEVGYKMQTQFGLGILNSSLPKMFDRAHMRVLFGGDTDIDFVIPINQQFINDMFAIAQDFLDTFVNTEIPPLDKLVDHSESYRQFLINEYKLDTNAAKVWAEPTQEITELLTEYSSIKESYNSIETRMKEIENRVCLFLEDKYGVRLSTGEKFIFFARKGNVGRKKVVEKLRDLYNIPDEVIEEIEEECRGETIRVPRFYPAGE